MLQGNNIDPTHPTSGGPAMRHSHHPNHTIRDTLYLRSWAIGLLACFLACQALAPRVYAGAILTFQETGGNVVATADGTIDLADLTLVFAGTSTATVYSSVAFVEVGGITPLYVYSSISGPASFGTGEMQTQANSGLGNATGINGSGGFLFVPAGYVSGAELSGNATWTGQTFATLGLTPGTYTYTWGTGPTADFFTVNVGVQSIPEPASIWLALIGSVGIFAHCQFGRRKTEKSQGPVGPHGAAE